jgi:hypothetical protein
MEPLNSYNWERMLHKKVLISFGSPFFILQDARQVFEGVYLVSIAMRFYLLFGHYSYEISSKKRIGV